MATSGNGMDGGDGVPTLDQVTPDEAWRLIATDTGTRLVDVRTRAEWSFVGVADLAETGSRLWPVEWAGFPQMRPDPNGFLDRLDAVAAEDAGREGELPERLLFICRSGARSLAAARAVAEAARAGRYARAPRAVTNVAEGFEGDLDEAGHRGRLNGWKARGLPWRQS